MERDVPSVPRKRKDSFRMVQGAGIITENFLLLTAKNPKGGTRSKGKARNSVGSAITAKTEQSEKHKNKRKRNSSKTAAEYFVRTDCGNNPRASGMLREFNSSQVYIVCGYTDMRRSIDGLAAIVKQNFGLEPCSGSLFLFCGKRRDRLKALLWEGDGFSCCRIKDWTMERFNGRAVRKKFKNCHRISSCGSCRDCQSNSQKQSEKYSTKICCKVEKYSMLKITEKPLHKAISVV